MTQILLVFAFVLFVIGTFVGPYAPAPAPAPWWGRLSFNPVSAGLAFWVASILFK
jgi:hypothetical protein